MIFSEPSVLCGALVLKLNEQYEKAGMAVADARGAIELAREEGLQEARQKGKNRRGSTLLLLMLEEKFGPVSEENREKVLNADLSTQEKWSLRLLKSDTLDGVFGV